ncbi:MAG: hypothetical protein PHD74_09475, partial [Candidatus Krumholzibacteria bacterium]|nr:hypothetical protein [Candidatus Krumholzibacteria bacterium]
MRNIVTLLIAFALVMVLSTSVFALVVKHLGTDAELLAIISDTVFVAEGRIGDLGGAATFELDLGKSTAAPSVTAQYAWTSGQA